MFSRNLIYFNRQSCKRKKLSSRIKKYYTEQKTATIAADKELNKEKEKQEQPKEEIKQQLAYNPEQPNDENKRIRPTAVGINEGTTEHPKMTDAVAIDEKMHKENINTDPV